MRNLAICGKLGAKNLKTEPLARPTPASLKQTVKNVDFFRAAAQKKEILGALQLLRELQGQLTAAVCALQLCRQLKGSDISSRIHKFSHRSRSWLSSSAFCRSINPKTDKNAQLLFG